MKMLLMLTLRLESPWIHGLMKFKSPFSSGILGISFSFTTLLS